MSKKVFFLIILLLIQLVFFPQSVLAVGCEASKIDWDPKIFTAGQTQYVLNFTIRDINSLNFLKNKYVRLLIDQRLLGFGGWYTNPSTKVDGDKFSIFLTGDLAKEAIHKGTLQFSSTEKDEYQNLCDVSYQVGAAGKCNLVTQPIENNRIPVNTALTIKIMGKANTKYNLYKGSQLVPVVPTYSITSLASTTTDNQGYGEFSSVVIPGNNGDRVKLIVTTKDYVLVFTEYVLVFTENESEDPTACYKDIVIDVTAPPPSALTVGPIQPLPAQRAILVCPKEGERLNPDIHLEPAKCTKGGGDTCDDGRGSAIKTAIGCIHTNPAEFVKDFLKFIIGIGGGLAFLMMLLGVFQMLTSAGNPETLRAGQERLTSAVIGLLFVIFAVLLLQIIGVDILGILPKP